MKLSIYGGTGFIGSYFLKIYPNNIKIKKGNLKESNNILKAQDIRGCKTLEYLW